MTELKSSMVQNNGELNFSKQNGAISQISRLNKKIYTGKIEKVYFIHNKINSSYHKIKVNTKIIT